MFLLKTTLRIIPLVLAVCICIPCLSMNATAKGFTGVQIGYSVYYYPGYISSEESDIDDESLTTSEKETDERDKDLIRNNSSSANAYNAANNAANTAGDNNVLFSANAGGGGSAPMNTNIDDNANYSSGDDSILNTLPNTGKGSLWTLWLLTLGVTCTTAGLVMKRRGPKE